MKRTWNDRICIAGLGLLIALTATSCRESGPATTEDKRAQGEALLKQMSDKLKAAQALTVSTTESVERVRRNNEKVKLNVNRQIAIRRPDRAWIKSTGDRDLELFYDGKKVTLVSHKEKVFGQIPAPATLHETVDMITDRYDIPLPIADLLSFDPHGTLMTEKTTGGLERRERIDGVDCSVLAYQHPNVDWAVWIPVSGEPLPKKLQITYKARRGQPKTEILFKDWNLSPQVTDATFVAKVPDDYEGIPVIQRASAVIPSLEEQEKQKAQASPTAKGAATTPTKPTKK
jgi:hypothetical protein